MANAPQMKIPIGADTQDFEKGARRVKQEMKDLDKVSSDAFASIGSALGVDTGKLGQFSNAIQGLGQKFTKMGTEGATAFGSILQTVGPLAAGIAGLGIGAATVAFKALNSEAEAFKNTVAGANMELRTNAYTSTYAQVLHDANSSIGRQFASSVSGWKEAWGRFKSNISTGFAVAITTEMGEIGDNVRAFADAMQKADAAGIEARRITDNIFALERRRKEQAVEIAKINAEIADKMAIARLHSNSIADRQKAISDIEALIGQKKTMTVTLEQQLAKLYADRSALASDDVAAADATLAQQQRAFDAQRTIQQEQNALARIKNELANKNAAANAAAAKSAKEEADAIARIKAIREAGGVMSVSGGPMLNNMVVAPEIKLEAKPEEVSQFKAHLLADLGDIKIAFALDPDSVDKWRDITREMESLASDMAVSIGESLGQLAGALINGSNPWEAFANSAISALGDLAISVGKIAISTGVSAIAIKASLTTLQGYAAIAAGVALVALGTMVKSGLSSIASGNYSASAGVVSAGSYSSGSGDYVQRDVYVNVTGTLRADGDELVAVLNNTDKKNYLTT